MLPLRDAVLPLWRISQYWSREIGNLRPSDEIFQERLASFWLGTLDVTGASGKNKVERYAILKLINRRRIHPTFSLIDRPDDRPGLKRSLSGQITVDLSVFVILPADETAWTPDIVDAAYVHLSRMSINDFDDLVKPGFRAFSATREAIRTYCKVMDYPLPQFWFGTAGDGRRWNSRQERDAEAWFKALAKKGPKEMTRKGYLADARKTFPSMPEDAFDRIWTKNAPDAWKKSGPIVRRKRVRTIR